MYRTDAHLVSYVVRGAARQPRINKPGLDAFDGDLLMALEALARCHLLENHTSVFVSYNLDDAKEKVLLARQVYE